MGYVFATILFYLFRTVLTGLSLVQEEAKTKPLVLISGFIHDVSSFVDQHPGGRHYLIGTAGKEATASFFGGVYAHSNAAHNVCASSLLSKPGFAEKYKLLSMMRVGILDGGVENRANLTRSVQQLRIREEKIY